MKNKEEKILEFLGNLSERYLYYLYNDYAEHNCYEKFFDMAEDFDSVLDSDKPSDIANMIYYGDFRPNDEYFSFDGNGNLYSFDYPSEQISFDELADCMIRDDKDFGWEEIREILDEKDGEE